MDNTTNTPPLNKSLLHPQNTQNNTFILNPTFLPTCAKIGTVVAKLFAGLVISAVGLGITFIGAKIAGFALGATIALLAVYSLAILVATVGFRYLSNKNDKSWSTAFLKGAGFLGVIALVFLCGLEGGRAGDLSSAGGLTPEGYEGRRHRPVN